MIWDEAHASALGTAPSALFWVALEQNGPWGARAATQSHLDPNLGRELDQSCREASGRFILIRRPGTHPDLPSSDSATARTQRVYVAGALSGTPWLLEADIEDPARLTRLTMALPGRDDPETVRDTLPELRYSPGPVLMICTNSRRDVCCSVRGRPVALQAAAQRPGQVWECSHTGGHRFAPTGVVLPHGQTLARLSSASAVALLDAATREELPPELLGGAHDRGRSHLTAAGQAAESVLRHQIREPGLLALSTTAEPLPDRENTWRCRVSHVDGRQWDVVAVRRPDGDDRPESCGKEPVRAWRWSVISDCGR